MSDPLPIIGAIVGVVSLILALTSTVYNAGRIRGYQEALNKRLEALEPLPTRVATLEERYSHLQQLPGQVGNLAGDVGGLKIMVAEHEKRITRHKDEEYESYKAFNHRLDGQAGKIEDLQRKVKDGST